MAAEKILEGIERLISPKFGEIIGELKAVITQIGATNERIDNLDVRMDVRINSLNERIDSLRNEMNSMWNETKMEISSLRTEMTVRLDSLEKRIPVIEEITALKIKIADIEKRLAAA